MSEKTNTTQPDAMNRRSFVSKHLAAAVAATTCLSASKPTLSADNRPASRLPERDFGKTNRRLPILACGGSAMVEKWQVAYGPQLSLSGRVAMIRHAFDSGIRYFDTSPNYGESESLIGAALHDVRDQIYLATKVGVPRSDDAILEARDVRASLEKSLEVLQTDHVDCVQIHGPVFEYLGVPRANAIYDELLKLREEKLFRHIGLTGHIAFEPMYRLIDTGRFDQLLIAYGYFPKGMDTILSRTSLAMRERCLSRAHELGMGVVAMKVMSSFVCGHRAKEIVPDFSPERLDQVRQAALRWVLRDERITLAVVGVTRPTDIDQNIKTLSGDLSLSDDDRQVLAEFTAKAFQSPIIRKMEVT